MSKFKLISVISLLLALTLLMSSCEVIGDIGDKVGNIVDDVIDMVKPGSDGTTDTPSESTSGNDNPGGADEECAHEFNEWETVLESTCAQKGKQVRVCSLCAYIESADVDLKAHTVEILAKVEPTCKEKGKTEGEKCSVCKQVLIAQQEIKAKGHTYVNGLCHCGAKDENYVQKYTIIFKDYNGNILSTQTVVEGTSAQAPENPTREGYMFKGWDKSFDNVRADMTVTAVYEKVSTGPQFVVSSEEVKRGDTVEITVALKNNPGIASIVLSAAFDSNALTLTEVIYNNALGGQTIPVLNMNSPIKLYWINGFADAEGDFILATLKFTVKSSATLGDHNITLSYNANDVYDISETNLPFEIVNGKVTVKQ